MGLSELTPTTFKLVRFYMKLLNEQTVADILGISVSTVRRMRHQSTGPKATRIGSLVRYRLEDVQQFIREAAEGANSNEL